MSLFSFLLPTLRAFLPWYLTVINLTTFLFYGADKRKAEEERRRTPESVLLGLAAWGGALGALAGMRLFRHKTQKWKFRLLVPLFLVLWAGMAVYLYWF